MNAHTKETITPDGEIITTTTELSPMDNKSLAVSLARAEIDMQVTTAHAFPRSIDRAVKNIMSLATLDEQTAEECVYALPRSGKAIKGPSIRFAEIIQSQWGNCRVGARVVHVDRIEKYVEAEGVFHDLETNAATTSRVRRRISDSKGKLYNEDMIVVTGNAACSIAKRNAILGGVPKAAYRKAYDSVEQVIAGDVKTLSERRDRAMKAFAAFGVTPEQVFAVLGLRGLDDVTLEHMPVLLGMHAALKSGEATVEEMFPRQPSQNGAPKDLAGKLDALATSQNGTASSGDVPSGGEVPPTARPSGASPSTPSPQPQPPKPTAADQAAPEPVQPSPGQAVSGAAEVPTWPDGKVPTNEGEYAAFARAWFEKVRTGTISPADAKLGWKGEMKTRNGCGVGEELRDILKAELDAAIAAAGN